MTNAKAGQLLYQCIKASCSSDWSYEWHVGMLAGIRMHVGVGLHADWQALSSPQEVTKDVPSYRISPRGCNFCNLRW